MTRTAVAYLRVSTDDQSLGIEAQRSSIEKWAKAHGVEIASWREDVGVSGTTPIADRVGLMAAIGDVSDHGATLFVVARRDRLARDVIIAAMVERLLSKSGATIESADGAGNGTGPEAELFRNILSSFAQFERALIASRTRAALAAKRARGEKTGGPPPYGFVAIDGRLVPCEDEQQVISRARQLRSDGVSVSNIVRVLNEEGRKARNGKVWSHAKAVYRMLAS